MCCSALSLKHISSGKVFTYKQQAPGPPYTYSQSVEYIDPWSIEHSTQLAFRTKASTGTVSIFCSAQMIYPNLEEASVLSTYSRNRERVLYRTIHPISHGPQSAEPECNPPHLRSQPQPCRYYSLPLSLTYIYISFASARRATRRFTALRV